MCKKIFLICAALLLILSSQTSAALDPDLVGWYKLDESSGSTANDSSASNNDGTVSGATWAPSDGIIDGAIDSDASGEYVSVPANYVSNTQGTVAMWIRIEGTQSGTRYAFGHMYSGYNNRIQIYCDNSDNQLDIGLGGSHTVATNVETLSADTWYHVALTWNNGSFAVYIDGVQDTTGSYSNLSAIGSVVHIGNSSQASPYEGWLGKIDDARIYDRALDEREIAVLASPELIKYYKLDESSGSTAADSSLYGDSDATANGVTWMTSGGVWGGAIKTPDGTDNVAVSTTGMSTTAGTVALNVRIIGTQDGTRYAFGHMNGGYANRIQIYCDGSDNQLDIGLGDNHTVATNIQTLQADCWYHLALTWNSGTYYAYVDGVQKATGSYSGLSSLGTAQIGNLSASNEEWQGRIDDVRIYDAALSQPEIAALVPDDNDVNGVSAPGQATNPSPSNGATGVSTTADLSWTAGSGATSHRVYFGTSSPGTYRTTTASTTYDCGTMSNSTTYYWRIDEVGAGGTTTGNVWNFTTAGGTPPGQASSPSPANSAVNVSTTADLSWTAGSGATSHNVYFGTTSPGTFQGNRTSTTFDCGTMTKQRVYYWRIDEVNGSGTTTGTVWSFRVGPLAAFPGAEGYGAVATGGRGGSVVKVTNLNTSGAGSLAAACSTSGTRTVVFTVSGVIPGQVLLTQGNVTIAGQTAPGAGITIQGMLKSYGYTINNAIIRFLRVRPNQPAQGGQTDAFQLGGEGTNTLILDHCSGAWGNDEVYDFYNSHTVTLQWSTIEESDPCKHDKGVHNFGTIAAATGSGWISYHHNLFTHHYRRVPTIAQYTGNAEFANNIAYNCFAGYSHEGHGPNITGDLNLYNNYYARGPNCMNKIYPYALEPSVDYYVEDVYFENWGYQDHPCSWIPSWLPGGGPTWIQYNSSGRRLASPAACSADYPVTVSTALQAYTTVIADAGCFPRDRITTQNAADVNAHTGMWRRTGPANPATSWFMYGLTPGSAPTDTDSDGMPDSWENSHGLNPNSASDRNNIVPNGASTGNRHMGYTYLEFYLNELAESLY